MNIVVKVGTHAIANKSGRPDHAALKRLVGELCELCKENDVVFVSSGAVAAGVESLGLKERPKNLNDVQTCAAVGQVRFISEYEKLFAEHGYKIAQVLLTHHDFEDHRRSQNVRKAIERMVAQHLMPIVNENDVVSNDELKGESFGDNDWLSFLVAKLWKADALVLLSTVDGFLDADGKRIPEVKNVRSISRLVKSGTKGRLSKGGMDTKLKAVKAAVDAGIDVYIANGRKGSLVSVVSDSRRTGTFFPGNAL